MNTNLDKIAQELYGKIRTRFPSITIGDEPSAVLSKKQDIPKDRFFAFEYTQGNESLGTIAITLDETDGVIVQVIGDLVNNENNSAYKFIRSIRQFAKDRLLNFDIQNIGKSNLDKRDYEFQSKRKEPSIMENKMYGTSKISYQNLGEARLIIKHTQPINSALAAGRTMHIESIYVENAEGERFKYPFKHLHGARALAEHLKHGGNPYDTIGKHITSLSEELAHLRKFKGVVTRSPVISETMGTITNRVIDRIAEIKKQMHGLQRPTFYESFVESFEESEEQIIPEDVMNDLVNRLTIRTFNEDLKATFPYIYKFIDESDIPVCEIDVDELLSEDDADDEDKCPKCHCSPCTCKKTESFNPELTYESFINSIVENFDDNIGSLFSNNVPEQQDAIDELNQILQTELKGGPDGINAIESLKGIINDSRFLNDLKEIDPNLDVRPLIQQYITAQDPTVAVQLNFGGNDEHAEEPEVEPELPTAPELPPEQAPMAPLPPAPMAEGRLRSAIQRAKQAGATLETRLDFGYGVKTIHEIIKEGGMTTAECGYEQTGGLDEMLKYISGFYDSVKKRFPLGGTRIKIKVKKDFEEGMFPDAQPHELIKILKFIDLKDPNQDEQRNILKLAGVRNQQEPVAALVAGDHRETDLSEIIDELNGLHYNTTMESIIKLSGIKK